MPASAVKAEVKEEAAVGPVGPVTPAKRRAEQDVVQQQIKSEVKPEGKVEAEGSRARRCTRQEGAAGNIRPAVSAAAPAAAAPRHPSASPPASPATPRQVHGELPGELPTPSPPCTCSAMVTSDLERDWRTKAEREKDHVHFHLVESTLPHRTLNFSKNTHIGKELWRLPSAYMDWASNEAGLWDRKLDMLRSLQMANRIEYVTRADGKYVLVDRFIEMAAEDAAAPSRFPDELLESLPCRFMTFGTHRDTPVDRVPGGYVMYMCSEPGFFDRYPDLLQSLKMLGRVHHITNTQGQVEEA